MFYSFKLFVFLLNILLFLYCFIFQIYMLYIIFFTWRNGKKEGGEERFFTWLKQRLKKSVFFLPIRFVKSCKNTLGSCGRNLDGMQLKNLILSVFFHDDSLVCFMNVVRLDKKIVCLILVWEINCPASEMIEVTLNLLNIFFNLFFLYIFYIQIIL